MRTEASWPAAWLGRWRAEDGKTVTIADAGGGAVVVTVAPGIDRAPYRSAELLHGGTNLIDRLEGSAYADDAGRMYLEIEAGTPELGPTYRLFAAIDDGDGGFRWASFDTPVEALILRPNTGIGLYDDWEDDLGVPWAYPFGPMRYVLPTPPI